jgi:hypothetical protein
MMVVDWLAAAKSYSQSLEFPPTGQCFNWVEQNVLSEGSRFHEMLNLDHIRDILKRLGYAISSLHPPEVAPTKVSEISR